MSDQPTALRLADALTNRHGIESFEGDAANELRQLHSVNSELLAALKFIIRGVPDTWEGVIKARAAIAKAEKDNHA
jgi:hypothetical protein